MFFLIWGFKTRFSTIMTGTFFCPRCGGDRPFEKRLAKRWFHLYYIPLFPTKQLGEQIKCGVCNTSYTPAVLNRPTTGQLSSLLLDGVRGLVVHVLRAGSIMSPAAREVAVAEVAQAGLSAYSDNDLNNDLGVVPGDLSQLFMQLGSQLADGGKEVLMRAGARVALADGPLNDIERQVLMSTGAALGMTPAHASGIIVLCEQAARSQS